MTITIAHCITVPSAVVGLEASFLDPHSLRVKWQPPLYPNGNITKYVIKYQESQYSVWEQGNIDWCIRQVLPSRRDRNEDKNEQENKEGMLFDKLNIDS